MKFVSISSIIIQYSIISAIVFVQASLRIGIVDACNDTIPFTIGSTIKVSKQNATVDVLIPNNCIGDTNTSELLNGLLLRFTGTGERLAVRVCDNMTRSYNLFYVSIYQGEFCPNTWSCVAGSYYPCDRERLIFDTTPGVIYTVFALVQEETFDVSIISVPRVSNDVCSNAQTLTLGSSVSMDVTYATHEVEVLNDCGSRVAPLYPGVWFNFTGTGDQVVIKSCNSQFIDPIFLIYKGGCDPSKLECVASARYSCTQKYFFDTVSGTSYTILVQTLLEGILEFSIVPRQKPRPIALAMVNGDPHISTLDGLTFDCQARGEFTMLKSLNSPLLVQGRFTKVSKLGGGLSASVLSSLVIREKYNQTIQIGYTKPTTADTIEGCFDLLTIYVDGKPLSSNSTNSLIDVDIGTGDGQVYLSFYLTELQVLIDIRLSSAFGCFLSMWILLPEDYRAGETLTGLLGNANGHVYDDWQTNLGVPLPKPDRNEALFQGGYDYCRTEWCIRNVAESLFTYDNGESFNAYFDCDAPYQPDVENALASASTELQQLCGTNKECLIDGIVGTIDDAKWILNETSFFELVKQELNITYNLNETTPTTAPNKAPMKSPTKIPTKTPPTPNLAPVPVPVLVPSPLTVPVSSPVKADAPAPVPVKAPIPATVPVPVPVAVPVKPSNVCGIFGKSLFCPFTFNGIIGRFIRRLFGF